MQHWKTSALQLGYGRVAGILTRTCVYWILFAQSWKSNISSSLLLFYLVSKLSFPQNVEWFLWVFLAEQLFPVIHPQFHKLVAKLPKLHSSKTVKSGEPFPPTIICKGLSHSRGRMQISCQMPFTEGYDSYWCELFFSFPSVNDCDTPGPELCLLWTVAEKKLTHQGHRMLEKFMHFELLICIVFIKWGWLHTWNVSNFPSL